MRINSKLSGRFVIPDARHKFVPMIWAGRGEQTIVTGESHDFAVCVGSVRVGATLPAETFKLIWPSSVQQNTMPSTNMKSCPHF